MTVIRVISPDVAQRMEVYKELAKTNSDYLEKILVDTYVSTAFIVSVAHDGALSDYKDKIQLFLENFIASYIQQFLELYKRELSRQEFDREIIVRQLGIDIFRDYPLLVYEAEKQIRALLDSPVTEMNKTQWQDILSDLVPISVMVDKQNATRDKQALLETLAYELAILRRQCTTQTERVQAMTELAKSFQSSDSSWREVIIDTRQNIDGMAALNDKIQYYEQLQSQYEQLPVTGSFPAIEKVVTTWLEKVESLWNKNVDEYILAEKAKQKPFVSVSEVVQEEPPVLAVPGLTKTLMPVAGMTFLGLFLSLVWVFGKNTLGED